MTKARSAGPGIPQRPQIAAGNVTRQGLGGYFRGVWEELRKVVWPARDELARMTGIVIATVILFAVIIGGADYLLGLGVHQAVTSHAAQTAAPVITAPANPGHATPLP